MHARRGHGRMTGGRYSSRRHRANAHTNTSKVLERRAFTFSPVAQLSWLWQLVLSLADRAVPTGIPLYTPSWLHSPFPSPSLSLTLEDQTGARGEEGVEGVAWWPLWEILFCPLVYLELSFLNDFRRCCARQVTLTQNAWSGITAQLCLLWSVSLLPFLLPH